MDNYRNPNIDDLLPEKQTRRPNRRGAFPDPAQPQDPSNNQDDDDKDFRPPFEPKKEESDVESNDSFESAVDWREIKEKERKAEYFRKREAFREKERQCREKETREPPPCSTTPVE